MNHPCDQPAIRDFTAALLPEHRLRVTTAACRVRFHWFPVRKPLTRPQKDRAAEPFQAAARSLRAAKLLLDTRHPAVRALTAVRRQIDRSWRSMTLPFPEPGIRLIRLDHIEAFHRQMAAHSSRLRVAAAELDRHLDDLRSQAARRLGSLFDPADYPASLRDRFAVRWDFPPLDPPRNLSWLAPSVHLMAQSRIEDQFEEAVRLAERGSREEFARRLAHLLERISAADPDGPPGVFRDGAVNHLVAFIARYGLFRLGSDTRLDELVALVGQTLQGVTPRRLRDDRGLRRRVAAQLGWVRASLEATPDDSTRRQTPRDSADSAEET